MPYVSPYAIALSPCSDLERVVRDVGRTLGRKPVRCHLAVVQRGDPVAYRLGIERPIGAHERSRRRPDIAVLTPFQGCLDRFTALSTRFRGTITHCL